MVRMPLPSEMPNGCYGLSGYGKDLSLLSIEEHTVARHVMLKL